MEEISCRSKISSFYHDFMDKTHHRSKTSRKYPQNMEGISCRNKISSFQPQNREEMRHLTKKGDRDVTFTAFS